MNEITACANFAMNFVPPADARQHVPIGSTAHKVLFCRILLDTHDPGRAAICRGGGGLISRLRLPRYGPS